MRVVWLLLLLAGCGDLTEGVSDTGDGSTSGSTGGASSSSSSGTPTSTLPPDVLMPECMADEECDAPLPFCYEYVCSECLNDAHCDGFPCSEGTCLQDPTIAVVVGYGFKRAWSPDGITWEDYQEIDNGGMEDDNYLRGVGYGNGVFVAVGGADAGVSVTTADGVDWENENREHPGFLSDVVYFEGTFVAAGSSGLRVQSADDGMTWEVRGEFLMAHFRGLEAGNGVVVAVGETYGGMGAVAASSADGAEWNDMMPGGAALRSIAFGADTFVAVGNEGRVSASADGTGWNDTTVGSGEFLEIVWTGDEFLTAADGTLWSSPDAQDWAEVETTEPRPVTAVFRDGYISLLWPASILRSVDLQTYEEVFSPGGSGLTDIAVGIPAQ